MTKELNELREKIIKAVPEIMEANFGNQVEYTWGEDKEVTKGIKVCGYGRDAIWMFTRKYRIVPALRKNIKYFGRPITLEDVILAWTKVDKESSSFKGAYDILLAWSIGKTLDQQSEETIKFLNEII